MKVKCSEIKIGNRVRKDLGDIDTLADSIKELGLLQPIGVTINNELVFGERRLAACKLLNHEEIEAVLFDSDELFKCEIAENVSRKSFVMSERVGIRKTLKKEETKKRGELMAKGIKIKRKVADSATFYCELAKLSGVSYNTAKKENVIVAFGNQEIIDKVDNNELSVNRAYLLVNKLKRELKKSIPDNELTILPVEEYTIVISDTYDTFKLDKVLSDRIKEYSETPEMMEKKPLTIIGEILNKAFGLY